MSDSWQCVHFGVHADDASESSRPAPIFCAPGGGEAEVLPRHCETARGHEVGQAVMCVSVCVNVGVSCLCPINYPCQMGKFRDANPYLSSKPSSGWSKVRVRFFLVFLWVATSLTVNIQA